MATNDVDYIDDENNEKKVSFFSFIVYWILELIFFQRGIDRTLPDVV